jgi:thiosulfate/3-mercaptopyruvate sulfurtransferase
MNDSTPDDEEFLVNTDWLAAHLDDPAVRIVDTRKGDVYPTAHIPNAVHIGGSPFLRDQGDVIGPAAFAGLISGLGIGTTTMVIAYDDGNNLFGGRLWWALNYYGHRQVRVLDGGFDAWIAEGRAREDTIRTAYPAEFEPRRKDQWIADSAYVEASIGNPDRVILDVRGAEEWNRLEAPEGSTPPGHIPGAVHLVWSDVIDTTTMRFKSQPRLREMFENLGIRNDQEIIPYCFGGIRAAHSVLALKLAGFGRIRNYEGSWVDWSRAGLPIEPVDA